MAGPTNALTYNAYVTQIATMAIVDTTTSSSVVVGVDPAFNNIIPQMLDFAEMKISRDLDLLSAEVERSYSLTAATNIFSVPTTDFVTIRTIVVNGIPLTPVSKEFLQNVYATGAGASQPLYFAPYGADIATGGNTSINYMMGPWPDQNYATVVTGTTRQPSLYLFANATDAGTKTTFISTWLPDLLIQASMIYISQFQRNFLPTSNDPNMPGSFAANYDTLLQQAKSEALRQRFAASVWTSTPVSVAATPTR